MPDDVKQLIRGLLKKNPAERFTFEQFFKSTAMADSKVPRPPEEPSRSDAEADDSARPGQESEAGPSRQSWPAQGPSAVPEHHNFIPPELLDPQAVFRPSKFEFRRASSGTTPQLIPRRSSSGPGSPAGSPPGRPRPLSRSPYSLPMRNVVELPTVEEHDDHGPSPRILSTDASVIAGETRRWPTKEGLCHGRRYQGCRSQSCYRWSVKTQSSPGAIVDLHITEISSARRIPLHHWRVSMPPTPDGIDIPTTNTNTTFQPIPSAHSPTHYCTLSSSLTAAASHVATDALSHALNLASKKLFGTGASRSSPLSRDTFAFPPSPRHTQINVPREEERDPAEDLLLQGLEGLAQKTDVLAN
jgi:serine/threonine-protein kinase ULK2